MSSETTESEQDFPVQHNNCICHNVDMDTPVQGKLHKFPDWAADKKYLPSIDDLMSLRKAGLWDDFVHHNPMGTQFQIPNQEFVESVADFLVSAIKASDRDSVNILEVGAGNGRLAYFLKEEISKQELGKEAVYNACDDQSWKDSWDFQIRRVFEVSNMGVEEAMQANPDIVISSWMPKGEDWTSLFRNNPEVDMFLMIGEVSECGTPESWEQDEAFAGVVCNVQGSLCWGNTFSLDKRSEVAAYIRRDTPIADALIPAVDLSNESF